MGTAQGSPGPEQGGSLAELQGLQERHRQLEREALQKQGEGWCQQEARVLELKSVLLRAQGLLSVSSE